MRILKRFAAILLCISLCMVVAVAQSAQEKQQQVQATKDVLIIIEREQVRFTAQNPVAQMQLQVFDQTGELVYDSGAVSGQELTWVLTQASDKPVKSGLYAYTLSVQKDGSETAQVRRGHFIVDRAKDRDPQTDRLWITTQNDSGVGTELTVARNENVTIAGANPTTEQQGNGQTTNAARDGEEQLANARTEAPSALQGTSGRIAKFVSSTSVGNSVMTELNGNVGLGTTNPTSKLEIAAQDGLKIHGYQPFLSLQDSNSAGRRSYIQGVDGDLIFIPNNFAGHSAGMILRDSNKPGSRVDIFGQDALTMVGFQPFLTLTDSNAGWARARIQNVNGGLNFQTHHLTNVGGSAMYIQNGTQNVGIGTASPESRLHVNGVTQTSVLLITGGSDFAENFDVNVETTSSEATAPKLEAGMVVSLDPSSPGELTLSTQAYDRRVAGIISGAGGVKPGMVMGQEGTLADGKHPVALSGRVYCLVDASQGAIEVGDQLTTSTTPGYAMKATDAMKAQGAIIGKAMTRLEKGKGLVLVLVALQ